jgi:hypothetical protein
LMSHNAPQLPRLGSVRVLYKAGLHIDRASCALATRCQHTRATLESAMAYVSTLGGGYYLTYHHTQAVAAAVLQMAIASAMDDVGTIVRTWTHLAYIGSSTGCTRVASWAAHMALALCSASGMDRRSPGFKAARVCKRYVHKLAKAREEQASLLSDRELVHIKGQGIDDMALLRCIGRTLVRVLPLPPLLQICAQTMRQWSAMEGQ